MGHPRITIYFARKRLGINIRNRKYADKIELSEIQKEIITGTILGDGCLRNNYCNTSMICYHGENQLNYVKYKNSFFNNLGSKVTERFSNKPDKRTGKYYNSVILSLKSNPALNEFYEMFYKDKVKYLNNKCFKYYSPLAMAIHFMDDGSKTGNNSYILSTNSFNFNEIQDFCDFLLDKYKISTSITKENAIYIKSNSGQKFIDLIKSYIIPEMEYKIHNIHLKSI
jgi:hypothetical protein